MQVESLKTNQATSVLTQETDRLATPGIQMRVSFPPI